MLSQRSFSWQKTIELQYSKTDACMDLLQGFLMYFVFPSWTHFGGFTPWLLGFSSPATLHCNSLVGEWNQELLKSDQMREPLWFAPALDSLGEIQIPLTAEQNRAWLQVLNPSGTNQLTFTLLQAHLLVRFVFETAGWGHSLLAISCWSSFTEHHQSTHCEQWESHLGLVRNRDFSQQESLANVLES